MQLGNAWYLLLLLPLAVGVAAFVRLRGSRERAEPALRLSSADLVRKVPSTWRVFAAKWLWALHVAALALIVAALARPRHGVETVHDLTKGVDIVMAIDLSESMLQQDLSRDGRNRLDVARKVALDFIGRRENDRLALVPFGKHAYRRVPLTLHHEWIKQEFDALQIKISNPRMWPAGYKPDAPNLIDGTSTAIGSALAVAVNALKDSDAGSKVVVLLTDGENNYGRIGPVQAAEVAREFGVRVYAIGAADREQGLFGVVDPVDETTLREIARITGGAAFRARDEASLARIYEEIDRLERTEIEALRYTRYRERFPYPAAPAAALVLAELVLGLGLIRRTP